MWRDRRQQEEEETGKKEEKEEEAQALRKRPGESGIMKAEEKEFPGEAIHRADTQRDKGD